ncbi:putative secreted protein [Wickerhamomyces ciferrii]|uniref:Protein phosphatase n=1 Tax=Wickerhamomyces ciferrii (strain ATCC 14091 / BCRC 22168 / CBS 111 / JCM 3599 / NBRC 0793 / NRRL Y-1031 F-60-10) TaxID=1206466 RepID=K0KL59_WICCF|nr:uncharacterized protein BN7_1694 [Wickerhamomyces ciferrii]CCH42149.1 putative secreted protein [Wickerhamomyces ciferrii]
MFTQTLRRSAYLLVVFLGILLAYNSSILDALKYRSRSINLQFKQRRFSTSSSSSSSNTTTGGINDIPFKYNVSVAFQPKERDENKFLNEMFKNKKLDSPTGEDNYFIAAKSAHEIAVGVADGVGGWAELGYDSSAISRELCKAIENGYLYGKDAIFSTNPQYLLNEAFETIQKNGVVKVGGTTACLGVFKSDGILNVANLGDSYCGVFRENKLILATKIQTHGFNTPYQLAIIPQEIWDKHTKKENGKKGRFIMDKPMDSDTYEFKLQKNDIIMFATDGVIDNINIQDIEIFLKDNEDLKINEISQKFVDKVYELSIDEEFSSVFSQELSKLTKQFYTGGKEDDITVVFVQVDQNL